MIRRGILLLARDLFDLAAHKYPKHWTGGDLAAEVGRHVGLSDPEWPSRAARFEAELQARVRFGL